MSHPSDASISRALPHKGGRGSLVRTLGLWHRRSIGRTDLSRLDTRALKDIGITRFEAETECSKPFWQL